MNHLFKSAIKYSLVLIAGQFLSSCLSLDSHTTGRTIGKDKIEGNVSLNAGQSDMNQYDPLDLDAGFLIMNADAKFGITDRLDLGAQFTSSGMIAGTAKFQFLGDSSSLIASSATVRAGVAPYNLLQGLVFAGGSGGIAFSVHPTDKFAIYAHPQFYFTHYEELLLGNPSSEFFTLYGIHAGVQFGSYDKVSLEMSTFGKTDGAFGSTVAFSVAYIRPLSFKTENKSLL